MVQLNNELFAIDTNAIDLTNKVKLITHKELAVKTIKNIKATTDEFLADLLSIDRTGKT